MSPQTGIVFAHAFALALALARGPAAARSPDVGPA